MKKIQDYNQLKQEILAHGPTMLWLSNNNISIDIYIEGIKACNKENLDYVNLEDWLLVEEDE